MNPVPARSAVVLPFMAVRSRFQPPPSTWLRVALVLWLTCPVLPLAAQSYQAIYAFGSEITATQGGPYAQGRWCNGPVWIEHLAVRFGLVYEPEHNLARGLADSTRILNQIVALPPPENGAQALFVVMPGILDFGSNANRTSNDAFWQMLIDQLIENTATGIDRLYLKGARHIALVNLPDLTRFPQLAELDPIGQAYLRNKITDHNRELERQAQRSRDAHNDLRVTVIDFRRCFAVVLDHAAEFGFTETDIAAWHDENLSDKRYDGPGSRYLFWDNVHPTSIFHALLAQTLEATLTSPRLRITAEGQGARLTFENLALGLDYVVEQTDDFEVWAGADPFQAQRFTQEITVLPGAEPFRFFRLRRF